MATQKRHEFGSNRLPLLVRLILCATKRSSALPGSIALDELANLVDDGDGIQIRFALRAAPGEQAMAAKHDAIASGNLLYRTFKHHRKLEARPLPGHPYQLVTELPVELIHLFFTICRGGERDAPVGMEMIYMREGKKSMQGSIDRSRDRIVTKRAKRIQADDLIFKLNPTVDL